MKVVSFASRCRIVCRRGSYVRTASAAWVDEMTEEVPRAKYEGTTAPLAPAKPPEPKTAPPTDRAYKAKEQHSLRKVAKGTRRPWIEVTIHHKQKPIVAKRRGGLGTISYSGSRMKSLAQ